MFEGILGNESAKNKLATAIKSNKITNAYMFTGPEGIGKKKIAEKFASELIKINIENSSDYNLIEAKSGENSIKIDQIRNLNTSINLKPYSDYKVYLINDAEKMTVQAQNALLKTLEEPPAYGIIILVTKNDQALLETIRSRCIEIKFAPLSNQYIKNILIDRGVDESQATMVSVFSKGSASRALEMSESQDFNELRLEVENFLEMVIIEKNRFEVTRMSEYLKKYNDKINEIIELLKVYIRDAILLREGVDESLLVNIDSIKIVRKLAYSVGIAQLGKIISILECSENKISSNSNFNSTVQTMALNIYEVVNI
ncbi:DNA polymerase III subunit [Peptostreptococcus faecalis]|uniref:DNA polymerase III subunit n=1 Tax=Peptostreptococcus faecalis TaxID=2045015 RepID=UPI000C7C2CC2|nr:DNA polymerase III subunit delta' C-terminal domain-containing protein [Peptostreptococcus faecalis]